MTTPANPTCFVHIGPHKTGSSSLKHFIRANEDELETRGLFFPRSRDRQGKRARNHQILALCDEIGPDGELRSGAVFWPEIDRVARGSRTNILISSEMFSASLSHPGRLDRILTFFEKRGYDVRMLAYVRDQPAWLNSWYVQSQKRLARPEPFEDFAEEWLREGRVEPARYLAPFLADQRCAVEVISFERAAASGLEDDFIRRCGIDDCASLTRATVRNTNAGAKTVFAARQIMERLGGSPRDDDGYGPIYRDFKIRTRELGWDRQPHIGVDEAFAAKIRARLAFSNDAFSRRHFGTSWAEVCPPRTLKRSVFTPEDATQAEMDEIEDVVSTVVKRFSRRRRKSAKA
ncbi:hypothetical protein IHQ68_01035 [Chelatococcus sambhunathii]|uniref:Sulfotransferase family n=1 Tax=Chelatococcus sambhunathii TaxID=363953 RepID=A0ABU1DAX0_9HYPH|nr:hypothetical protein [Chelatococcus sambhunathii]MDR4305211.1 hypothetical protein [Chelatococcus sambhunathii]